MLVRFRSSQTVTATVFIAVFTAAMIVTAFSAIAVITAVLHPALLLCFFLWRSWRPLLSRLRFSAAAFLVVTITAKFHRVHCYDCGVPGDCCYQRPCPARRSFFPGVPGVRYCPGCLRGYFSAAFTLTVFTTFTVTICGCSRRKFSRPCSVPLGRRSFGSICRATPGN